MQEKGIIINGLLPNSTAVMAIMDELFRAFNGALKHLIHSHYAKKTKANAKQVQRRKAEIASKIARGEDASETELAKTHLAGGLNQIDGSESNFIRRADQGRIYKSQPSYCDGIHEGKGNGSPPQAGL